MLPVQKPEKQYHTLEDIQRRKEDLAAAIQKDSDQFGTLWKSIFTTSKDAKSKGDWAAMIISNGITAVDTFLLVRKLMKSYGHLFGRKKR